MEKKGRDPNDPEHKYAEIDNTLKCIDRKIKEGNILGHNKVSAMAEQFANKNQDSEPKVQRSVSSVISETISTLTYNIIIIIFLIYYFRTLKPQLFYQHKEVQKCAIFVIKEYILWKD